MRKIGRILSTLLLIISIVILLYCIYITVMGAKNKEEIFFFGYKPYIIQTGSMEPAIRTHALIIVKKGGFDTVKAGDAISFKMKNQDINICHRVVGKNNNELITKGDNNNKEDTDTVEESNYIGKVVFHTNITAFVWAELSTAFGIIRAIVFASLIVIIVIFLKRLKAPKGKRMK